MKRLTTLLAAATLAGATSLAFAQDIKIAHIYGKTGPLEAYAKQTQAGLMLGLGETREELLDTLADVRAVRCDALTLGQYLTPTLKHVPVARYLPPAEFDELAELARSLGFAKVASGPFVRSSYHADELAHA